MNTPTRQLANRTAWLRSKLGGFTEAVTVEVDENPFTLADSTINKFVILNHTDSGDVELEMPDGVAGNKIAFFLNSVSVAGLRVTVDGIDMLQGDFMEVLYTGVSTRVVTVFTGWGVSGVEAFARNSPPDGYLAANGAAVSRTTYARLFARIGTTFGVGNGTTTFNLPDLRGEFIRGWDNGRGIDTGRVFGSAQADEFESHTHSHDSTNKTGLSSSAYGTNVTVAANLVAGTPSTGPISDATGGSETRPRNIALLYCIKY